MNKFEKAQEILKELDADGWLIISNEGSDINSPFMLGIDAHIRHYIYVATNGIHKVLAVQMEAPMIGRALEKRGITAEIDSYSSLEELIAKLKLIVNDSKIAVNIGENIFSKESTAYADYIRAGDFFSVKRISPETDFISAAQIIYQLRSVKSSEELADLRNVCKTTMEILEEVPNWVKSGMTEREIKARLNYEYNKVGEPSFPTIVGTQDHSADPHHNTSNKKVGEGSLLIDTGLKIDQMCSDITWTYWVGNNPSDEFIQAYNALHGANKEASNYYVDGTPSNLPALKCREFLKEAGYDHEKLFIHGLGHPIGFEVHDIGPRVSWRSSEKSILMENMVLSNEPGLYWPDKWGIRLEDDIIIGKEKSEPVTSIPKEPLLI